MKGKWSGSSSSSGFGFSTQNLLKHLAVAKALHVAIFQVSLSTSPSLLFCWHSFLPLLASCCCYDIFIPNTCLPSSFPSHCLPNFSPFHKPKLQNQSEEESKFVTLDNNPSAQTLRNHTSPHLAIPPTNFLGSSQIGENPKPQFFFFFFFFFFSPL